MLRRPAPVSVLAALVMAAALILVPTSAGAEDGPAPAPAMGSQFHGMWGSYTDAERAQVLDTLQANGVEWVRLDVGWSMLQPDGPGTHSEWGVGFVDQVLTMITDRGLKPLVTLWLTPDWANAGKGDRTLPDDVNDYARIAGWAAQRWAGQVEAWEVWNEPNHPSFMTGADAGAYGRLLKAAYPAIKAADPAAEVVFGGPMYNDVDWISRAYDAGARGSFDVMATHPYQAIGDLPPEHYDGTKWTLLHAKAVRDFMVRNGDGHKPLWFTEFGWSSHENLPDEPNWSRGVSRETQAAYLVRALQLIEAEMPWVTNVFWYSERDRSDADPQNNNYGLLGEDLRPKPVLLAVSDHLRRRRGQVPPPGPVTCSPSSTGAVALCEARVYDR